MVRHDNGADSAAILGLQKRDSPTRLLEQFHDYQDQNINFNR